MWFRQKTFRSSFENLRTNGRPVEIIGNFSVRAEPVEAFLGFFSRIVSRLRPFCTIIVERFRRLRKLFGHP